MIENHWRVISTYDDDGHDLRIVEAVINGDYVRAEMFAQGVREFRADQTQGPVVTIERVGEGTMPDVL